MATQRKPIKPSKLTEHSIAVAVTALSTAICFGLFPFFSLINLSMIYLLGTLMVASRGSRSASAVSALLSVACFDFFFVPPRFTFSVSDAQYVFTFVVMFLTAMVISHLTIRLRLEANEAREAQRRTALMHEFSQLLSNAADLHHVFTIGVQQIYRTFSCEAVALVPNLDGKLEEEARSSGENKIDDKDMAVAQWVYETGDAAGPGTDSLPQANGMFVPIVASNKTFGVLLIRFFQELSEDQKVFMRSFVHQMGIAIELATTQITATNALLEAESERMRSALLSSVSHDLRTPLTAIVGSASTLLEKKTGLEKTARDLVENIYNEGRHLSQLVQNLLQVSRLEAGAVKLNRERYPIEDIVGSALEREKNILSGRKVTVNIDEDLPLVSMDAVLIEQVFLNLLENAARHTPEGTAIDINVTLAANEIQVSIADEGEGIRPSQLESVFEKFQRSSSSVGAGLGLSICRAIVKVHGGRIWAENRRDKKGAVFHFTIPQGENHGDEK